MACHFLLIQSQIKAGKTLKGGRELAQMTKAQSCAQLEKSHQQLESYQRKEERLRRWTEGWGHPEHWETAGEVGHSPRAWLPSRWATALPFPVGSDHSLCYARYWLISLGLEKPMPWSWGWKKANLPLGRALGHSWLLPPDSWGRCHPFPSQIQRDWCTSQQFLLLRDHTSEKNLILFLLLEWAGLWPAGLRAGAPGALALVGYLKLWVLVKLPSGEPGAHRSAHLFWKLSIWQFRFIVTTICPFSSLIFYWEASVGFQPISWHPNKSWELFFLQTSLCPRLGKVSVP